MEKYGGVDLRLLKCDNFALLLGKKSMCVLLNCVFDSIRIIPISVQVTVITFIAKNYMPRNISGHPQVHGRSPKYIEEEMNIT
jgi:hypothetical protein